MAYKVYLNSTDLIIDTTAQQIPELQTISAQLKISAVESGSFNFTLPQSHKCYGKLNRLKDIIDVYRDEDLLWSGRIYSIVDNKNGTQSVSCEGILSMLADSIFRPITFQGKLKTLVGELLLNHNEETEGNKHFFLRNFTIANSNVYREYVNYETTVSRIQDLLESFGGYIMAERSYDPEKSSIVDIGIVDKGIVDVGENRIFLDWVQDFTEVCEQKVELASNLLEIKKTINSEGIATVLIPIGAKDADGNRLTIASVNGGSDMLFATSQMVDKYGYIVQIVTWDDIHEASILKTRGQQYLTEVLTEKTQIKVKAVDLADAGYNVENFHVGQKIEVTSKSHGIDAMQFNCIAQKIDLFHPGKNSLELGEVQVGYIESQISTQQKAQISISQDVQWTANSLRSALDLATRMITGNQGGCVVMHSDPNVSGGLPYEILIMDTPDINTAQRLWRMNQAGIGFSKNGYWGPYDLAITMDGRINADFITTGSLTADIIRAGILRSQDGKSYWDLNTGELKIIGELGIENTLRTLGNNWGYYITGSLKMSQASIPGDLTSPNNLLMMPALVTEFWVKPWANGSGNQWESKKYVSRTQSCYAWTTTWTDPAKEVRFVDNTRCKHRYLRHVAVITDNDYDLDSTEDPATGTSFMEQIDIMKDSGFRFSTQSFENSYYGEYKDQASLAIGRESGGILLQYVTRGGSVVKLQGNGGGLYFQGAGNEQGKPDIRLTYGNGQTIDGKQISFNSTSSRRYKKNIRSIQTDELDPDRLYDLEAKEFQYKNDFDRLQYEDLKGQTIPGFIAEDVAEIYPSAVIYDSHGNIESWDERRIIPGMLQLIQKQKKEIDALKTELSEIKKLLERKVV